MKTLLVVTATCISSFAIAQNHTSISRSINDDGKTLSIKVNGNVNGKAIDYDKTFNVSNRSKGERDALKDKILDSLSLSYQLPQNATGHDVTSHTMELKNEDGVPSVTSKSKNEQSYAVAGTYPYTKEIKYNPGSGILFMKYRFTKKGVENTYERLMEAKDKTAEQREETIKAYEREIGLTLKN